MVKHTDRIVILGYPHGCKYCDMAKSLLSDMKIPFTFLPVTDDTRSFLKASGLTTVPAVFVNGSLVGGYTQLHTLLGGNA